MTGQHGCCAAYRACDEQLGPGSLVEKKGRFVGRKSPGTILLIVSALCVCALLAYLGIRGYYSPYRRAARLYYAGKFSKAVRKFDEVLDSCDENTRPKVYYMMARCYKDEDPQNLSKAIEYYRMAYEKYPDNYLADDAKAMEAHCEYRRSNYKRAMDLYSELVKTPIGNGDMCDRWEDLKMVTVKYILDRRGLFGMSNQEVAQDFRSRPLSDEERSLIWRILHKERNFEILYLFDFYEGYLQMHNEDYEVMYEYYRTLVWRGQATKAYAVKERIKGIYRSEADMDEINHDYNAGYHTLARRKIDSWLEKYETLYPQSAAYMYHLRGRCLMKLGDSKEVVANLLKVADTDYSGTQPGYALLRETALYLVQDVPFWEFRRIRSKLGLCSYGKELISAYESWHYWREFDYGSLSELIHQITDSPIFNEYDRFERSTILLEEEIVDLLASRNQLINNKEQIDGLIRTEIKGLRHHLLDVAKKKSESYPTVFRVQRMSDLEGHIAGITQVLQERALTGDIVVIRDIVLDAESLSVAQYLRELYQMTPPSPIVKDLLYGLGPASLPSHLPDLSIGTFEQPWEENDYHILKNQATLSFLKILFLACLKQETGENLAEALALFHCEFLGQGVLSPFCYKFGIGSLPPQLRSRNLSRAKILFSRYLLEHHAATGDPILDDRYVRNLISQYLDRIESMIGD